MRYFAILFALLSSVCSAQDLISIADGNIETTTQIVTATKIMQGDFVLGETITGADPSEPVKQVCKLIEIKSESEQLGIWIEDQDRNDAKSKFREIRKNVFFATERGTYYMFVVDHDSKKHDRVKFTIDSDEVKPTPPKPEPPKPEPPKPQPPQPTVSNLVVLVVFESGDLLTMPAPQREVLQSTEFRLWLNSKCSKEPGTSNPAYRFFDQHVVFPATCDTTWCKLMKQPRAAVPWLIIADNNNPVFEGPLPATVTDTKSLIERYLNGQ